MKLHRQRHIVLIAVMLLVLPLLANSTNAPAAAAPIANDSFQRTWARTDQPVASGAVSRTWMWGSEAITEAMTEDYAGAPGGTRTVQYFDKSRMEDNSYNTTESPWNVTNGLLVVELMSGQMQVGDTAFTDRAPAEINVAGDPDDPLTYAVLAALRDEPALPDGAPITQRLDASGTVSDDPALASYGVTAAQHLSVTGIDHQIASPFWSFMTSSGLVLEDGQLVEGPLFPDPYYATGFPITEAYWADVRVGGQSRLVLLQCFERRCLTYTPDNEPAWQVEAGNVGQHYYRWRYGQGDVEPGPSEQANALANAVLRAQDDATRIQAIMDVLAALNVGVYTGDGQMVLGGAERGAADFYLYDIEVQMMSEAIERGQTYGLIDLAMQLTAMGLVPEGQILDPALVRQALLTVTAQAAADPANPGSLVPLLTRQLGLPRGYDLLADASLDTIRLDPLSYFLLLGSASIPLIDDHLPLATPASTLVAESNGVLKPVQSNLPDPCNPTSFLGDASKHSYGWLKNFADLLGLIPQAVAKASGIVDAVHGAMLSYSVAVTTKVENGRRETHYGPAGHEADAGQPITFKIKVKMRDKLPQVLIDCGWILGTAFPAEGGIPGVSVHWFWDNLDKHGQITCGNACVQTPGNGLALEATNGEGIATMTFQPKEEENPDEGWIVEEHGIVTGVALYQSKFGNLLGSYAQYLTPKSDATRWVVKWHEPPGWNVTMEVDYDIASTWKHIGFDARNDYFLEDVNGSGTMTIETFIPLTAVDTEGPQVVEATAHGNGSEERLRTDYTKYRAYELWEEDCHANYQGSWDSALSFDDTYSDANGQRTVLAPRAYAPLPMTTVWTFSGSLGGGAGDCMHMILGLAVNQAVVNAPAFSLDREGEQHFTINSAEVCQRIPSVLFFQGDDTSLEELSCTADVEWTIEVTSRQQGS